MSTRSLLLIAGFVLALAVFATIVLPVRIGEGSLAPTGVRFAGDPLDLVRFADLGRWSRTGEVPYRDYGAEYPPLAVTLFGIIDRASHSVTEFRTSLAAFMAAAALAVVAMAVKFLDRLGLPRSRALLLLLPAALYSTTNRYDILVPLLLLPTLAAVLDRKDRLAGFLLALAVSIKFIPVLLFPLLLRARHTDPVHPARWYRSPLLYAFVGTFAILHLAAFLWVGQDFAKGYFAQLGREPGLGGLLAVIAFPFTRSTESVLAQTLLQVFRGLVLIPPLAAAFAGLPRDPVRRPQALLILTSVILLSSVLFAPFSSPQWILWLTPVLLLIALPPARWWVGLLIALDLATYIQFPVSLDLSNPFGLPFYWATVVRTGILLTLLGLLLIRGRAIWYLLDLPEAADEW